MCVFEAQTHTDDRLPGTWILELSDVRCRPGEHPVATGGADLVLAPWGALGPRVSDVNDQAADIY